MTFRAAHTVHGRDEVCTCCGHYSPTLHRTYDRCPSCYETCPAIPHRGACARRPFEAATRG